MNSTLADPTYLTGLHPYSHPSPLDWLWQDHLAAGTIAVRPALRLARSRNDVPRPYRPLSCESRIRYASIDHSCLKNPIVPAIPKTLINYSKILSLFVKQRTYPHQTAQTLSTNGHPTPVWFSGSGTEKEPPASTRVMSDALPSATQPRARASTFRLRSRTVTDNLAGDSFRSLAASVPQLLSSQQLESLPCSRSLCRPTPQPGWYTSPAQPSSPSDQWDSWGSCCRLLPRIPRRRQSPTPDQSTPQGPPAAVLCGKVTATETPPSAIPSAGTTLLCVVSVAIVSVTLAALPPESARVAGLNEQAAFAGSPRQLKVMFPEYPAEGLKDNAYLAGVPAATVTEELPPGCCVRVKVGATPGSVQRHALRRTRRIVRYCHGCRKSARRPRSKHYTHRARTAGGHGRPAVIRLSKTGSIRPDDCNLHPGQIRIAGVLDRDRLRRRSNSHGLRRERKRGGCNGYYRRCRRRWWRRRSRRGNSKRKRTGSSPSVAWVYHRYLRRPFGRNVGGINRRRQLRARNHRRRPRTSIPLHRAACHEAATRDRKGKIRSPPPESRPEPTCWPSAPQPGWPPR